MNATVHTLAEGKVTVAALIAGEGVDLVVHRPGKRPRTIQLTMEEAHDVAEALRKSASESATLTL